MYRLFTAVVRVEMHNSVKFKIQLYAISCKERKRTHDEFPIQYSVLVRRKRNKISTIFASKTQLAFIVLQRRSRQRENKAKTYERGQMNVVSACRKNSSSQSELCVLSHNLTPINKTIQASQVTITLIHSLPHKQIMITSATILFV
jgi:hypothetical protein